MKKKNKKLVLNKQIMANLSNMQEITGGLSDSIGPDCNYMGHFFGQLIARITRGNCDLVTIGWDDPSICISKKANWCHGVA